jgi:hypothetical protein
MFGWLVADGWCWFVMKEEYCWLVAGDWFVLREKYCWLVVDNPSEQAVRKKYSSPFKGKRFRFFGETKTKAPAPNFGKHHAPAESKPSIHHLSPARSATSRRWCAASTKTVRPPIPMANWQSLNVAVDRPAQRSQVVATGKARTWVSVAV